MSVHLVGGGPDTCTSADVVAAFVAEALDRSPQPRIGVVLHDVDGSAGHFLPQYAELLGRSVEVLPVPFDGARPPELPSVDALVVAGGRTPAYRDALAPSARLLVHLVAAGMPYLGFSAGAMVAPATAVLGGWLDDGAAVCPSEWSEGLDTVATTSGLGLVETFSVDVHTGAAGLLGRSVSLVLRGETACVAAIDEDTCLVVPTIDAKPADCRVVGRGTVTWTSGASDGVTVRRHRAS